MGFSNNPLLYPWNLRWWTSAILKIGKSPSQWKIIRFWWNLVHNSTSGTRWQPNGQIWRFLKFKMADGRHFKNRFLAITHRWLADFSEILRWQAVFHRISAMRQIPAFHRMYLLFFSCSLGFGERRLSYRLRYTCYYDDMEWSDITSLTDSKWCEYYVRRSISLLVMAHVVIAAKFCVLRGVYSDTTELNWPSWTAYSQVSRVFVYDVTTYKLSQLSFTLSSWVQLSSVELSWVVSL